MATISGIDEITTRTLDGLSSIDVDTIIINGQPFDPTDYLNKLTDTSDDIVEGIAQLFLTPTERADIAANTAARHSPVTIGTANGLSVGGVSGQELSLGLAGLFSPGAISAATYLDIQVAKAAAHPRLTLLPGSENGLVLDGTNQILSQSVASSTVTGALSNADWVTFNGKQDPISVSAPLTFVANNVAIPQASAVQDGYLSATDFATFASGGAWSVNTAPTPDVVYVTDTTRNVAIGSNNVPTSAIRLFVNGTLQAPDAYLTNSLSVDTAAYIGALGVITSETLQVAGGARVESGNLTVGTGQLRVGSAGGYVQGRLGIGTTAVPSSYQLDVTGTGRITGAVDMGSTLTVSSNVTAPDFSIQRFSQTLSRTTHGGQWWGIAEIRSTASGNVTIEYSESGNHATMEFEFGCGYGQNPYVHLVHKTGYSVYLVQTARFSRDPSNITYATHRLEIFLTGSVNWSSATYPFDFKLKLRQNPTANYAPPFNGICNLYSSVQTGTTGWNYVYATKSFTEYNERYHDVEDTGSHWFRTNGGNNIRQVIKPGGNPLEVYDNAGYSSHRYSDTLFNANLDVGCGYNTSSATRAEVKVSTANGRLNINSGSDGIELNAANNTYPIYANGPLYMKTKYFYKNFSGYMLINTGTTGSFFANTVTGTGKCFVFVQCLAKGNGGGGALYFALRRNYAFLTAEGQITLSGFRGSGNWNNFNISGMFDVGSGDVVDLRYINDTNPYEINEIGITVYVL